MESRSRFVAAMAVASAAALVGALGTGLTFAGVASTGQGASGVTFTSQPGVAQLVAHYTVSPAQRPEDTRSGDSDNRALPRLTKQSLDSQAGGQSTNVTSGPQGTSGQSDGDGGNNGNAKTSFIGQSASATTCSYFGPGCNPPDLGLAAGTRFVLQGVNTQWEVLDTSGHVQPGWPVSAQAFFGIPNVTNANGTPCDVAHKSQPFLSDPRALYDSVDRRFWAAMLQVQNGLGVVPDCPFKSVYYIAVSQSSDPRGSWNVYEFNMSLTAGFAADFTQIGVNRDAIYFSANMFGPANGLNGGFYAEIFEANKAKMERGQGGFTADGFFNLQGQGPGITTTTGPFLADTVQPAINIDSSGGSGEVFADTVDGPDLLNGHFCGFTGGGLADACSGLILWRMTNPTGHDRGGSAPKLSGTYVASKPFAVSPPQTQPSCSECVDALDLRFTATPQVRGGVLYASLDTAVNNGTQVVPGIMWAEINLSGSEGDSHGDSENGNSANTGYYNFSGNGSATFGAMMPDGHGHVLMLFEHMSSTTFPEARYIMKEIGSSNFHGAGTLLKAGENSYRPQLCGSAALPVCRWGDFEATSYDGAGGLWFAGEYANTLQLGPPQNGRNWGTWIGAVSAS